jgi:transposase
MNKKYVVTLTDEERRSLRALVSSGKGAARKLTHARILLQADSGEGGVGWTDERICEGLGVGVSTVERVRQRFVEEGLGKALVPRKSCRAYGRKLDGDDEAHLIALACSDPPTGRRRWTLRLLAGRMVALEYVAALSYETVRGVLKKTSSSRG